MTYVYYAPTRNSCFFMYGASIEKIGGRDSCSMLLFGPCEFLFFSCTVPQLRRLEAQIQIGGILRICGTATDEIHDWRRGDMVYRSMNEAKTRQAWGRHESSPRSEINVGFRYLHGNREVKSKSRPFVWKRYILNGQVEIKPQGVSRTNQSY